MEVTIVLVLIAVVFGLTFWINHKRNKANKPVYQGEDTEYINRKKVNDFIEYCYNQFKYLNKPEDLEVIITEFGYDLRELPTYNEQVEILRLNFNHYLKSKLN